ncbi:MAG: hypothetical protein GY723_17305 [bacterium]|nr:hypothetical protein [bacterium]
MIWWLWSGFAGLPVGALAVLAFVGAASPASIGGGALTSGVLLVVLLALIARRTGEGTERVRHLAGGSTFGLAALPACLASLLGLAPGAPVLLFLVLLLLILALLAAVRRGGPGPGLFRQGAMALTVVLGATVVIVLLTGFGAALGSEAPPPSAQLTTEILDVDAQLATLPLPECSRELTDFEVLLENGAHPRFDPEENRIWYDAATQTAGRQIFWHDLATGTSQCWTCGEQGNNYRPAVGYRGTGMVFVTDRHASWRHPRNTELHAIGTQGQVPGSGSRRLTDHPGADDHAWIGPASGRVLWSRETNGGYALVTTTVRTGHGGLRLGESSVMMPGGSEWVAPLAWSPDARTFLLVRGNPYQPPTALSLDPTTGEMDSLGRELAWGGGASFNGDGSFLALATTQRNRTLGLLPAQLGFLLAATATRDEMHEPLFLGTGIELGEVGGERLELELGELASWGEPTGISLSRDSRSLLLGQRRARGSEVEERILRLTLSCQ